MLSTNSGKLDWGRRGSPSNPIQCNLECAIYTSPAQCPMGTDLVEKSVIAILRLSTAAKSVLVLHLGRAFVRVRTMSLELTFRPLISEYGPIRSFHTGNLYPQVRLERILRWLVLRMNVEL